MQGRSDNEILAWIDCVGGTEAILAHAFSGMCDAFRADRASGRSVTVAWHIRTRDCGVIDYHLMVEDGMCHAEQGACSQPGIVLDIGIVDFLRLLVGALDSQEAVENGKLVVFGDLVLVGTIRDWFHGSN